jgi:hypothetical protein
VILLEVLLEVAHRTHAQLRVGGRTLTACRYRRSAYQRAVRWAGVAPLRATTGMPLAELPDGIDPEGPVIGATVYAGPFGVLAWSPGRGSRTYHTRQSERERSLVGRSERASGGHRTLTCQEHQIRPAVLLGRSSSV